jgi:hypothetical protein
MKTSNDGLSHHERRFVQDRRICPRDSSKHFPIGQRVEGEPGPSDLMTSAIIAAKASSAGFRTASASAFAILLTASSSCNRAPVLMGCCATTRLR